MKSWILYMYTLHSIHVHVYTIYTVSVYMYNHTCTTCISSILFLCLVLLFYRVTTHWTLLSCLDVEHCITLLHLALLEQKIVLHSYRPALLTSIGEAIRSILFPLQWQCTYIPMCPLAFASYLQAPVPFIIGRYEWMRMNFLSSSLYTLGMDSRYFESFSAPPEVCVLDLDADTLIM